MPRFFKNWMVFALRCWGSVSLQNEWPASVVGIIEPTTAAAPRRGNSPVITDTPPNIIVAPLARTTSSP